MTPVNPNPAPTLPPTPSSTGSVAISASADSTSFRAFPTASSTSTVTAAPTSTVPSPLLSNAKPFAAKPATSVARRDPFALVLERYHTLPRSGKWIAVAGTALAGWFILNSWLWPISDKLSNRADNMSAVLERASSRASDLPEAVADHALVLGPNSAPRLEAETKSKLSAAIDATLRKKDIRSYGLDMRPAQALPSSVLPDVAARIGGVMGRLTADLRFEATPEAATAVVAALDADPAVDAISDLRITYRRDTRRVSVQMTVEKWGVMRKSQRGGA